MHARRDYDRLPEERVRTVELPAPEMFCVIPYRRLGAEAAKLLEDAIQAQDRRNVYPINRKWSNAVHVRDRHFPFVAEAGPADVLNPQTDVVEG